MFPELKKKSLLVNTYVSFENRYADRSKIHFGLLIYIITNSSIYTNITDEANSLAHEKMPTH